ncbi:MAG TPA: hypothetical protein VKP67_23950 [Xanthobacteraceae bacterium]|nr:hypothetical protein [Xanthobacteraceae bacterium]
MKLTSALVERTLTQFDAQAIPDDDPAIPQLNRLFGDHTFFLDSNGLNIIEPAGPPQTATEGQVVKIASWDEGSPHSLAPHEPEPTDVIIRLAVHH